MSAKEMLEKARLESLALFEKLGIKPGESGDLTNEQIDAVLEKNPSVLEDALATLEQWRDGFNQLSSDLKDAEKEGES